jgi:N-acylglucosamine-6-phosphate 2-epimerase
MKNGIIVSCQAEEGSAFNNVNSIVAFAKEAERGGAVGVRIEGYENIKAVRENINIPIIGIIKRKFTSGNVWITPTVQDAVLIEEAGADFIAADATGRKDSLHTKNGWQYLKEICIGTNIPVIGDMANSEFVHSSIVEAEKCGCKYLSTTLSGYIGYGDLSDEPDFEFLKILLKTSSLPIIAEGRYSKTEHIQIAKKIGVKNIVIGSSITRPHLITQKYKESYDEL